MKKIFFYMLIVTCIATLNIKPIMAEENLYPAGEIIIRFNTNDKETVGKFIYDYRDYGLEYLRTILRTIDNIFFPPTYVIHFNFDNNIIDELKFLDMINNDARVYTARFNDDFLTNFGVFIRIKNYADYNSVVNSHGLNFNPYVPQFNSPFTVMVGSTEIYNDRFKVLDELRKDDKIVACGAVAITIFGSMNIWLYKEIDANTFLEDYLHLITHWRLFPTLNVLEVDFNGIDDFEFIEVLNNDERVRGAWLEDAMWDIDDINWVGESPGYEPPVNEVDISLPTQNIFSIVYPNPANEKNVSFKVLSGDRTITNIYNTEIVIYNLRGQIIKKSNDFQKRDGENSFVWDQRDMNNKEVASGVYFYKIVDIQNNKHHNGRFTIIK